MINNEKMLQIFSGYSGLINVYQGYYVGSNIPRQKLLNAIASYAQNVHPDDVYALYDITVFGGAKDGVLFTSDSVYYRDFMASAGFFRYDDITNIEIIGDSNTKDQNKKLLIHTRFSGCHTIDTNFIRKQSFANMLNDLLEAIRSRGDALALQTASTGQDQDVGDTNNCIKDLILQFRGELCVSGDLYTDSEIPLSPLNYAKASYAQGVSQQSVECLFVPVGMSSCGFVLTGDQIALGCRKCLNYHDIISVEAVSNDMIVITTKQETIEWKNNCVNTGVFSDMLTAIISTVVIEDRSEVETQVEALCGVLSNVAEEKGRMDAAQDDTAQRHIFSHLRFDLTKIFPTLVISTMSSGKSTLINALIGAELLPSLNTACTAKAVAILDNDEMTQFRVHMVSSNGDYELIEPATKEVVESYNSNGLSEEFVIEGEISGIKNSTKAMMIFDTPGINNSLDETHTEVTINTINLFPEGLIIYLINAEQMGTYDDAQFLKFLVSKTKNDKDYQFIFALNKMDSIDPEKEDPYELLNNCRNYLQSCGIEQPRIVSTCSLGALLFKRVLRGETLSRKDVNLFQSFYTMFEDSSYSMKNFSLFDQDSVPNDTFSVGGMSYTRAQLLAALDNTGIPALESMIDSSLVRSLELGAPEITFEK